MRIFSEFIKKNKKIIFLCLLAFTAGFFFSSGQITDYDYWFHYKAGEYFFQTGQVPQVPIGSWYGTEQGLEWISHEWLFGCFIYLIANWFGTTGVYLFVPIMAGFIMSLTVLLFKREFEKNTILGIIGIFLAASVISMGSSPRPHLFAYLFTVILFYIIKIDSETNCRILYFLPLLTIFWVNMHGGSYILIHITLLISILIHLFKFRLGKIEFEKQSAVQLKRRLLVMVLCILAVFINGHGLKMVMYPFTNIGDSLMQSVILEWSSPDLKIVSHYKIYLVIALGICAMISTKKNIKSIDIFSFFIFLALTSRSYRFAPQMALISIPIMLSYSDALDFIKFKNEKLIDFVLCYFILMYAILSYVVTVNVIDEPFNISGMPSDKIIAKIKEVNPERLLNGYNEGGYLLYNDIEVFFDGRADIYSAYNLRDGITIYNFSNDAKELIDKYNFDYILAKDSQALQNYMEESPIFELVINDGDYYLYHVVGDLNE